MSGHISCLVITFYNIGKMLAGVGIFLLGLGFMEETLQRLAGRNFKLFLKKQTSNKVKAIAGGAAVAGLFQSSSIVNLLVVSLAGAGILKSVNALAVILGSNLGSTVTNWIVALFGFSYDIDNIALPLAGVSGIFLAFFSRSSHVYKWCRLLLGFSFLFIGIAFIKEGMIAMVKTPGDSIFNYPVFVYFLVGIILTTIVQSSSATVALTLSALYAQVIPFMAATAIVLGSEIGSSSKLFLVSAKGSSIKKGIAVGNFIFNTVTAIVLLAFLHPLNRLVTGILHVNNQLICLVFFQTLVNVISIFLFYPFLEKLAHLLEKQFTGRDRKALYINKIENGGPSESMAAMEKESHRFILNLVNFMEMAFGIRGQRETSEGSNYFGSGSQEEMYGYIKELYGEIHGFYINIRKLPLDGQASERLEQLMNGVRNGMYAAKNIRDMWHDIDQLRNSSNDIKYNFYQETLQKINHFCSQVHVIMNEDKAQAQLISQLYKDIQQDYTQSLQQLYKENTAFAVNDTEITTLLNFNRELYTALKSVVFGLVNYVLGPIEAESFDKLPGFIR